MLTITQKEMLMELIKEGVMTFEVFLDGSNAYLQSILNVDDVEVIKEFALKTFELGYIKTADNELSDKNFYLENRKLLIVDMDKVFEDDLFSEFKEYEELKIWFNKAQDDISLLKDKTIFISALDNAEYINISENIVYLDAKMINDIEMMVNVAKPEQEYLLSQISTDVFFNYYNSLLSKIDELPKEYQYAKDIYSFKNYYNIAKRINSKLFKELNRNDLCFCGSGKKFKKCCMI